MFKGIAASGGYALGRALKKQEKKFEITEERVENTEDEIALIGRAIDKASLQLKEIIEKTRNEVGEEEAKVFEAHEMFLEDPEFVGAVKQKISEDKINAPFALKEVTESFLEIFSSLDDEYMKERASDIKDVSDRIMKNLLGIENSIRVTRKDTVVIARDLTPSDTASFDKELIGGMVTEIGGRTSHTAIMARTLEIPAVVGVNNILNEVEDGDMVIVDGIEGRVIINPDEATINEYMKLKEDFLKEKEALKFLANVKTVTKEGKRVEIAANIGHPRDVTAALENGAEGVGLYRTEFLYMDKSEMPDEEEQFEAYREVLEKMKGMPVVIRTLDIGGDKKLPYLKLPEEMNPFLGYRAIRLCLDRKDIFKVQLRALLRASVYGKLRVMFPMVSTINEYTEAMEVVKECRKELDEEKISYSKDIQWGIMVEIPSAAVIADEFAKIVGFFSIGTNDLIQYTLAADRMNEKVSYLYDPMHPAVLRLIKMVIDAAHKEGKWCGMCGEMAGDEKAIPVLLEMGLDEFSMSASSILKAKSLIHGK